MPGLNVHTARTPRGRRAGYRANRESHRAPDGREMPTPAPMVGSRPRVYPSAPEFEARDDILPLRFSRAPIGNETVEPDGLRLAEQGEPGLG